MIGLLQFFFACHDNAEGKLSLAFYFSAWVSDGLPQFFIPIGLLRAIFTASSSMSFSCAPYSNIGFRSRFEIMPLHIDTTPSAESQSRLHFPQSLALSGVIILSVVSVPSSFHGLLKTETPSIRVMENIFRTLLRISSSVVSVAILHEK